MENFTSTISHEFRTPIATALTFIDILPSVISDAEQRKYLQLVMTSLNLLLSFVRDLLDLNCLKSDKFRIKMTSFDPFEAI